jgi:hypothetical protein
LQQLNAPPLDRPRPPDLDPPENWLVDWLSRPASDHTIGRDDAMAIAHGVDRLSGD